MKIHIHSKKGLFHVISYGRESMTLSKKDKFFSVPSEDFKCFANGKWNSNIQQKTLDNFLTAVRETETRMLNAKIADAIKIFVEIQELKSV
jgi:hypothetical protein